MVTCITEAKLIFTSRISEGPSIQHIGFAQEHSPAGNAFNATNRKFLVTLLVTQNLGLTEINLMATLEERFSVLLPKFVTSEDDLADPPTVKFEAGEKGLPLNMTDDALVKGHGEIHGGFLKIEGHGGISVRQKGAIGANGEIIPYYQHFEPKPNIYDMKEETEDGQQLVRYVEVECAGVGRENVGTYKIANGIRIEMCKEELIDRSKAIPYTPIQSTHGLWKQDIQFEVSEGRFEYEGKCRCNDGIFVAKLVHKPPEGMGVVRPGVAFD